MGSMRNAAPPGLLAGAILFTLAAAPSAAAPKPKPARVGKAAAAPGGGQREADRLADVGASAYREKRYPEAYAAFEASLRLAPSATMLMNLANLSGKMGRGEQAIAYYKRIVAEFPQDDMRATAETKLLDLQVKGEEQRGEEALRQGRFEEALDAYRAINRLRPGWRTLVPLAEAQQRAGRLQDAIRSYERVLQEDLPLQPREAAEKSLDGVRSQAEEAWGRALFESGQAVDAARAFELALRLRPRPQLLGVLWQAQHQAGQHEAALAAAERHLKQEIGAEARRPTEAAMPELRARALDQQAGDLFRKGRAKEAFAAWSAAYAQRPLPTILLHHARAQRFSGDLPGALRRFEECLRYKEGLSVDERIETESAVLELREQAADRRAAAQAGRKPPLYRQAWFWGVVAGVVGAGAGLGVGLGVGLGNKDTRDLTADLGFQRLR